MITTITTISDAKRLVRSWTERYLIEPTDDEILGAARALVRHVGGYGGQYDSEAFPAFELDANLYGNEVPQP